MCNMNKINRMISKYNYTPGNSSRIKYIVIHYVGALGGAKRELHLLRRQGPRIIGTLFCRV